MKSFKVSLLSIAFLLFTACEKEKESSNCQAISKSALEDEWKDTGNEVYDLGGRLYSFRFKTDSFFMQKDFITDILYRSCEKKWYWEIYAKGSYTLKSGKLTLEGFYCDSTYSYLQNSPCKAVIDTGSFSRFFDDARICDDTLILENTSQNTYNGRIELTKK